MGPLRVWRGDAEVDAGPRQQRALLALLLAQHGRPVGLGELVDLIWMTDPPASAVNLIQKYIGALRRVLEPGVAPRSSGSYLALHGNGYRLTAGPDVLDLAAFGRFVTAAKAAAAAGRTGEALDRYAEALRLCQGPSGGGLADNAAAAAVFAGIDGQFVDAAVDAAGIAVAEGRPGEVLAPLRLAARMFPLHEPVHASLMVALAGADHQAEGLAVYQSIRERLADELGVDPGRGLREAYLRVLTPIVAPPAVVVPAEPPPAVVVPVEPPPAVVVPAQLPPDLPLFVGRRAELAALDDLVAATTGRTGPLVVAMDGMGGVGKSTLAAHFAHRVARKFTDGQLYLDLQGHEDDGEGVTAVEALRSLLYALGLRGADAPESLEALVGAYRSLTAGKRILVLLDNVRDPSQVQPLLPGSAGSLVLVTSRFPQVGLAALGGARLIRVDLPDPQVAREMLERRLAHTGRVTGGDAESLDAIVELCGRLPLALAILGARLSARPRLSLASVVAELRDDAHRLAAFPGGRGVRDPRTTFAWSYRQLSPDAARLFRLLSVALTPGITAEAAASLSAWEPRRTRESLMELAEAALVTEDDHGRFTSHVLVKSYAEELFRETEPPAERAAAISRLLQHYLHSALNAQSELKKSYLRSSPPPPPPDGVVAERQSSLENAYGWFDRHRDVLFEAVHVASEGDHGVDPWRLALAMPQYLESAGLFRDWEDVVRTALRAARERGDAIGEAHLCRSLAGPRWYSGANDDALDLLQTALRHYTEHGMTTEQSAVLTNLQNIYDSLGEHEVALEHARQAVALGRLSGERHTELNGLLGMGQSLAELERFEEAVHALRQALDIGRDLDQRTEEAIGRHLLAQSLAGMGRADEAIEEYTAAVQLAGVLAHGPIQVYSLRDLSKLLLSTGDVAGARRAFERAVELMGTFQDGGPGFLRADLEQLAQLLARHR
ncbi:AAA family ATPase [Nonomuraea sp. PA05]|uniref:AfsR/SARP family transcriptional regulator n=1 Tax=Nonomuraea sp. PA05 TaxID=2604466 RepID=UPI0011D3433F|nr:BTAD domain-containing putative transcriptional regulator [Nonomuraea sp. PA05]TYB57065.1 AAA family ATPase [Nonomuraea sp. PA05]